VKAIRIVSAAIILVLLLSATAAAAGLSGLMGSGGALPDPADLIGTKSFLYEEDVVEDGLPYVAFTFPMPGDYDQFLMQYAALASAAGYDVSEGRIMDMDAHKVASGAKAAWLIPDYRGALLFLVSPSLDYAPLPTPTPTPRPTPKPTPRPAVTSSSGSGGSSYVPSAGGGHTEYVEVKQDCFACVNGKCSLCHGSGWYRNYGVKVPCSIYCETCDGLGYWYTRQPVWVP